jgi:hypothetical protein
MRHTCLTTLLAAVALVLPSCEWDGHFTVLGYNTRPNYDTSVRTVRVPVFQNLTYIQRIEFDLTEAIVREIEAKTPYKVVGLNCDADTELTGTVVNLGKNLLNRNQLNEVREAETVLAADVVWRNLRTGEVLSGPRLRPGDLPPPPDVKPNPVRVFSTAGFIPELGESFATARKKNVDRLAVQVVSMMEAPW